MVLLLRRGRGWRSKRIEHTNNRRRGACDDDDVYGSDTDCGLAVLTRLTDPVRVVRWPVAQVVLMCSLPGGSRRDTPAKPVLFFALLTDFVLTILLGELLEKQSRLRPVLEPIPIVPGDGLELVDLETLVDVNDIVLENICFIILGILRLFLLVQNQMSMVLGRATKVRMFGFVVFTHKLLSDSKILSLLGFGNYLFLWIWKFSLTPRRLARVYRHGRYGPGSFSSRSGWRGERIWRG